MLSIDGMSAKRWVVLERINVAMFRRDRARPGAHGQTVVVRPRNNKMRIFLGDSGCSVNLLAVSFSSGNARMVTIRTSRWCHSHETHSIGSAKPGTLPHPGREVNGR